MKKLFCLVLLISFICANLIYAGRVKGYTKSNGTYVYGYNRSNSNNTVKDNYSYFGNFNPYTGSTGKNYYKSSPSSDYYNYTPKLPKIKNYWK